MEYLSGGNGGHDACDAHVSGNTERTPERIPEVKPEAVDVANKVSVVTFDELCEDLLAERKVAS